MTAATNGGVYTIQYAHLADSGSTITGFYATNGGYLKCLKCKVTLDNLSITGTKASNNGGVFYFENPNLADSSFSSITVTAS